tara:strand:- start:5681 stop:8998 length:3318 start_codon:yes stop_codon:yes gene_type:complete
MAFTTDDQNTAINDMRQKSLMDIVRLGPDEMAGSPAQAYDVANFLGPLFKGATKMYGDSATARMTDAVPNVDGVGQPAIDARPRVGAEGNLTPPDLGYKQTQDAAAADVLSPEGQAKFAEQGNRPTDLSLEGQRDAQLLAEAEEAAELSSEQQLQQTVSTAQRGVQNEQQGFNLTDASSGLADEGQALEVLEGAALGRRYMQSIEEGAPFNWNYIDTTDDVKALMQAVSDSMPEAQEAAMRGPTITNAETLADAQGQLVDALGITKRVLKRKVGTTFNNAADATAARLLLADSAKKLAELATKVVAGEGGDVSMLQFRRQLAIHNGIQLQIKGMQTEAARLLQSFQIPVTDGLDPIAAAALRTDVVEASGGQHALRQAAMGLVEAARKGEGAFNQTAQRGIMSRVKEGLETLYINGLLSNPRSNFKNVLGNAFFMAYQLPEEFLAGMFGATERAVARAAGKQIDYTKQQYMADPLARMAGWFYSFGDAWAAAGEGFRRGIPGDEMGKVEFNAYRNAGASDIQGTYLGRAMTELYQRAQLPSRFLLAGDEFFKVLSQNGELFTMSHRQMQAAKSAGMTDQQAVDEGMMMFLNPRVVQPELDLKSKYDTLMTDHGKFSQAMSAFQNTMVGRYIMPFATAPTNDMLLSMRRLPFIEGLNPYFYAEVFGSNPAVRQKALGRMTLAGTTMAYIAHYAAAGHITGGRPVDKKTREKLPKGWQPYSFVFRGEGFPTDDDGDPLPLYDKFGQPNGPLNYVGYSGLGPASSVVGVTANALQFMSQARSAEDRQTIASAGVFAVTDYFKELPFLQGVSNIFLALQRQDATFLYSGPLGSMNLVPGVPNPYSALTRAGERAFDNRITKVNMDFDIYTEDDVVQLTDEGALPKTPDGDYDFRYVGLAKGGLSGDFFRIVENGYNQGIATNIFANNADAEVPLYDTLGRMITDGPTFEQAPFTRLFNAISPIMIGSSEEQPDYIKELARIDWPIPQTPKNYLGVDLTIAQQSYLVWLAKGDKEDIPPGLAGLKDNEGRQLVSEPVYDRKGRTFREALEDMQNSRRYRKSDTRGKRSLMRSVNDDFIELAWIELTALPSFERLGTAAIEIQNLKEEDYR